MKASHPRLRRPLVPPFRFEQVEPDLYRGAYPTLRNLEFLAGLELRTILSLIPEEPTKDLKLFAAKIGAKLVWIKASKYKESIIFSQSQARDILELAINRKKLPIYIHCIDGLHVTGLIVMLLRKLQHWTTNSIYEEFSRFVGEPVPAEERRFVLGFEGDEGLLLPDRIPSWLWRGVKITRHPTIKLVTKRQIRSEAKSPVLKVSVKRSSPQAHIHFIDPITSSNPESVASFDSLLCTPVNIRNLRIGSGGRAGQEDQDPALTPPLQAMRMYHQPRMSQDTDFSHTQSNIQEYESNSRYSPCPYIVELVQREGGLGGEGKLSAILRALALEGLTVDASLMSFAEQ